MKIQKIVLGFIIIVTALNLTGCITYEQMVNFQDGQDLGPGKVDSIVNSVVLRIQSDDVIQVLVSSYEVEEAERFNIISTQSMAQLSRAGSTATAAEPIGYRVDENGMIDMPVLGKVHIEGFTLDEVRELIRKKIDSTGIFKQFSLQVRYVSFKVTILGEVNNPGVFNVPSTKITVLEAIGMARDVTVFSNRDNILVIRELNGQRTYSRINLKSKSVFNSEYYYLQPNDIVYVEPHKSRILATPDPFTRYVGTIVSLATLVTLIIALFQ